MAVAPDMQVLYKTCMYLQVSNITSIKQLQIITTLKLKSIFHSNWSHSIPFQDQNLIIHNITCPQVLRSHILLITYKHCRDYTAVLHTKHTVTFLSYKDILYAAHTIAKNKKSQNTTKSSCHTCATTVGKNIVICL